MRNHSSGSSELQDDYKGYLLSKLTTAAQKLQNDPESFGLQVDFCRRVEVLLFFAIKARTFKWKSETQDVWALLKEVSPKHITNEILLLKSVRTDMGRIRAWIRVTVNECTLQSYIALLADPKLTKKYYESVAVFHDQEMVSTMTNLISLITDNSVKVVFNCDSFDYEVAPSATDLTTDLTASYSDPSSRRPSSASSTATVIPSDDTASESTQTSLQSDNASLESREQPSRTSLEVSEHSTVASTSDLSTQDSVSLVGNTLDPAALIDPASLLPSPEVISSDSRPRNRQLSDENLTPRSSTSLLEGLPNTPSPERLYPSYSQSDDPQSGSTPVSNGHIPGDPETATPVQSSIPVVVQEREGPIQLASPEDIPLLQISPSPNCPSPSSPSPSSPLSNGYIPGVHAYPENQRGVGGVRTCASAPLLLHSFPPAPQLQEDRLTSQSLPFVGETWTLHPGSPPSSQDLESVEGSGDEEEPGEPFPTDIICSSPLKSGVGESASEHDTTPEDLLPGTPKDLVCDEEIYRLRQKMGNSLHASGLEGVGEMLAERVEEREEEEPYGPDSGDSAKSLTSSEGEHSGDSADNLLQLIQPEREQPVSGSSYPVPGTALPGTPTSYEPHSLGSSLYRLFSRGPADTPKPSQHLENLAQLHSVVTDEVPLSGDDPNGYRQYLMGATRATACYTYESANNWLSLSKDMWWWLQRRVITEHECKHPSPPTSDKLSGSPNSSLLDLCTEQCPCCNAIVVDICNSDIQDPNQIPISSSCPPFSNITQHMMHNQQSPQSTRQKISSLGDARDYFNLDILENPAPAMSSLERAIELQKVRTQNTEGEVAKKKEMDILVTLRRRRLDLANNGSDSSSSENLDTTHTVLGHNLLKSSELSGYCAKCSGAIYRRIARAYVCSTCGILLHRACINDVSRQCSLAKKDTLRLKTSIAPAHGLHEQNYSCYDCGTEISYSSTKVHQCDYSGRYYCSDCHKKTLHPVPARILYNWDFRPRPLALQSHEVITFLSEREYINVERINPRLFDSVSSLSELRELRERIILYKAHFVQCSRAMKEGLFLRLRPRQHFIDSSKLYTLRDLQDLNSGSLLPEVQRVVDDYETHYAGCSTCSHLRFACAACAAPPLISPFSDKYSLAQCSQCHGVLHRACFNRSSACPYCSAGLVDIAE